MRGRSALYSMESASDGGEEERKDVSEVDRAQHRVTGHGRLTHLTRLFQTPYDVSALVPVRICSTTKWEQDSLLSIDSKENKLACLLVHRYTRVM